MVKFLYDAEGKVRWLDIGNGGNFEKGFHYMDILPKRLISLLHKGKYIRVNILQMSDSRIEEIGQFDLIRMQHAFEHLSYEEGQSALINCAKLLKKGGVILITTPDLKVHIDKYLHHGYKKWRGYRAWAEERIPKDSPDSFYFSVFCHSMHHEPHKWCYDFEGLQYQLKNSGRFENIQNIEIDHELAEVPFTHNRPEEDVCVIATRI